jgi:hypothetical protein
VIKGGSSKKALMLAVVGVLYFTGAAPAPTPIQSEARSSGGFGGGGFSSDYTEQVGPIPVEASKQLKKIRKRKQNEEILTFINAFVQCH